MDIHAQIIRDSGNDKYRFLEDTLGSYYFDKATLERVAKKMGISYAFDKTELLRRIMQQVKTNPFRENDFVQWAIDALIQRPRQWLAMKIGEVPRMPTLGSAHDLLWTPGTPRWYGPVQGSNNVLWYIYPLFIPHKIIYGDQVKEEMLRWLCFARVTHDTISLHWSGFSHTDKEEDASTTIGRNSQFQFWNHVPNLFVELEKVIGARVNFLNLQNLVLHSMINDFDNSPVYEWKHLKIRSEAHGIALNARTAYQTKSIEDTGLIKLARSIKNAIAEDLTKNNSINLPDEQRVERVVLNTLIREHGALSYEFALSERKELMLRMHVYFGFRGESSPTQDRFPHIKVYTSQQSDIEQMDYFLSYARTKGDYDNLRSEQLSLLRNTQ